MKHGNAEEAGMGRMGLPKADMDILSFRNLAAPAAIAGSEVPPLLGDVSAAAGSSAPLPKSAAGAAMFAEIEEATPRPRELHLPRAVPLTENEFATGALYGLLNLALGDSDQASRITAAIERLIDAKVAQAMKRGPQE